VRGPGACTVNANEKAPRMGPDEQYEYW